MFFEAAFARNFGIEGGNSNSSNDGGGKTMFGITARAQGGDGRAAGSNGQCRLPYAGQSRGSGGGGGRPRGGPVTDAQKAEVRTALDSDLKPLLVA